MLIVAVGLWLIASALSGGRESVNDDLSRGPISVAGVEVPQPVADLGHYPVDTPVKAEYTLRNSSAVPVRLGEASIQVLEGC